MKQRKGGRIMTTIDLNCDMGEGFGRYSFGVDEQMMLYISSANIACGFHAGDFSTMNQTVQLALNHNVAIGAHPGFPDRQGFGRREMMMLPTEIYELVLYQIGALQAFVQANGGKLHHVKPHGALYNMAAQNSEIAEAIAKAVYQISPNLILYGLANSELTKAGERFGLPVAHEVFADRTYQPNGTLTPRTEPNALITNEQHAIDQVLHIVRHESVRAVDGTLVPIQADTVCIHGDGEKAVLFAEKLNKALVKNGVTVRALNT
jgi:5-oxoprolinase (ATP-hydrolysing) subunit A